MAKDSKYKWNFVVDLKGGSRSFNNPDLERFKNGRYRSLTREVIQNSIDARLNKNLPVRVEFVSTLHPVADIPDREGLLKKVSACLPMAEKDDGRKEAFPWFQNAKKILEGQSIEVLKMSDHNTLGMEGPCEDGHPFYAYMKAMGVSVKSNNAAGSHGIGKRAPLLSSKLRTIVVATRYKDKITQDEKFLTQGFSLLITHREKDEKGKSITIDHEGFWGDPEGCLPSEDPTSIPEWMRRNSIGTDLYLLGFDKANHWHHKMTALAMTNFFAAFARNTLEVTVQDTHINKQSISSLFDNISSYQDYLDDPQEKINLELSKHFYDAINAKFRLQGENFVAENNPDARYDHAELPHLGHVEIRIIVKEGLPQEYALIRSNMLIMRELPNLKRFPNYKDFVAVIECTNPDGERLLRSLEPSRHDTFEIDQIESEEEKNKARVAISKLTEFIRKALKKHAQESGHEAGSVDFLSQFLSDESSEGAETGEVEKDPNGKILITPKKIKFKADKVKQIEIGDTGGGGGDNPGKGNGGGTGGNNPGDGQGGNGGIQGDPMKNLANAPRVIESKTGRHLLSFNLSKSGNFKVSVRAVGLDSEEQLSITETNLGTVINGVVVLDAQKASRVVMDVKLDRSSLGCYRLVCEELVL